MFTTITARIAAQAQTDLFGHDAEDFELTAPPSPADEGPEDYSGEEPLRDDAYADRAAADWAAHRTGG